MKCPTCKEPNLLISERKGIEIDYCPECRGIWLDRGELDKLIEKSKEEAGPTDRERDRDHDRDYRPSQHSDHQHKHYKRKKSFLEELFD